MNAPATPPNTGTRLSRHWEILALSVVALLGSVVLQVRGDGRVVMPGLAAHPLPHGCLSQRAFGARCPACGLTRSFIHLAHGRWHAAWSMHRLGWLVFAAAALQVPYRLARICRPAWGQVPRGVTVWLTWTLVLLLVGNWMVEMLA